MSENGYTKGYKQGYKDACDKMNQIDNEFIAEWNKYFPFEGPRELKAIIEHLDRTNQDDG